MTENRVFPGNEDALKQFQDSARLGEIIPFVGSGVSVPLYPSWTGLCQSLLKTSVDKGLVKDTSDIAYLETQIRSDPAAAASALESLIGAHQFRDMVAEQFGPRPDGTPAQKAIIDLGPDTVITTNYDSGLETCVTNATARRVSIRNTDKQQLTKWRQNQLHRDGTLKIIHWHGVAEDPSGMIVTSDDYVSFYSQPDNREFVSTLWRDKRLAVIGFGLSDPPLMNICEFALRQLQSANRHFAFIGVRPEEQVSPIAIKQFSNKFRLQPIFYEVRNDDADHSALLELLAQIAKPSALQVAPAPVSTPAISPNILPANPPGVSEASSDFESGLLVFNGRQLYVEPRLTIIRSQDNIPDSRAEDEDAAPEDAITVEDVASSAENVLIFAMSEVGSTTLGKRLVAEVSKKGKFAAFRDASSLHPYRGKLQQELPQSAPEDGSTLVLDSYSPDRHERLLKEIVGLNRFARLIVIISSFETLRSLDTAKEIFAGAKFSTIRQNYLTRTDVRSLASTMLDTSDNDLISQAVERSYDDLLSLCIPLTPANIIMYLSVIIRDGDFSPINRVQIIEKYLVDLLKRPSDLFKESFNARNRIDVISAFVYSSFESGKTKSCEEDWLIFCKIYKKDNLVDFDERALLTDLLNARVIISVNGELLFKYKFFYLYFLGRYIAGRRDLLIKIIDEDKHITINGLVEVITSISAEGEIVVGDLLKKLRGSLDDIWTKYPLKGEDPFLLLEWPKLDDEQEQLWGPIFRQLAAGPYDTSELDQLKRSLQAEKLTENQKVTILHFDELESKVYTYSWALSSSLVSCDSLSGATKLAAADLLVECGLLTYMIGLMYAPAIARSRVFYWNGIVYRNSLHNDANYGEDEKRQVFSVASLMGNSVTHYVNGNIGSKKLGEVFKTLFKSRKWEGFESLALFSLIVKTKPREWASVAEEIISSVGRKAYYLRRILFNAKRQFHEEINTNQERTSLKRLIALIRVRRDLKVDAPGEKAIKSGIQQLENSGYFEETKREESDAKSQS